MKIRILVAAVFVPLLFVVMFFLPPYALAIVVAAVCAVCAYELLRAIGAKDNVRVIIYTVVAAAAIPAGTYFQMAEAVFSTVLLVLLCLVFVEAIIVFKTEKQITFAQIMTAVFAGVLIPYMLSGLIILKNMEDGRLFVLLPVVSAFITDGGAYFCGVFLGRHKVFPRISPSKTAEGYIGGLIIGAAAIVGYGAIIGSVTPYGVNLPALAVYGVAGAVVTELGDLAFSLVKREFDVKDYGRLLPGHGGLLDRFDSMVFTAPAMYLMVSVIPAIIIR